MREHPLFRDSLEKRANPCPHKIRGFEGAKPTVGEDVAVPSKDRTVSPEIPDDR